MVYISSDGNVAERKKILRWSLLKDICYGIYDFFAMFLASVIHPPTTVTQRVSLNSCIPLVLLFYSKYSILNIQFTYLFSYSIGFSFYFTRGQRTVTNYAQRHGGRSYRPSDKKQQSGGNIRGIKSLGGCSPMGGGGG